MTEREKIAHLLRRFGLGASLAEVNFYEPFGLDGTIERLIEYQKYDEGFDISAWALAPQQQGNLPNLRPPSVAAWWVLRMMTTQRPLQEKLTLFWHDHFAISASKVDRGSLMLQYLETLRSGANGNFLDLLVNVSKDPAMLLWLDNNTNVKGRPNENYAREVMELFTVGIGNYTEEDIQEAARAFTGWKFRPTVNPRRIDKEQLTEILRSGRPLVEFYINEREHDSGMKKVLGNVGPFGGEDICGILAARPETARYLTTKLWEWFAYEKPEPKVQERLAKAYMDGNFEIKKVLYAIVESEEFWSQKCVRKQVKNPVDFSIAICRQLGIGPMILAGYDKGNDRLKELPKNTLGGLRFIVQSLNNQGMSLLYPPDVAGWDWGTAWISSATMVERIRFSDLLFNRASGTLIAQNVSDAIAASKMPENSQELTNRLLEMFDAEIPSERKKTLVSAVEESGGVSAINNPRQASLLLKTFSRALFAAPEFHFC
ncbi:MAG TPA: DUF1800 domain-containing protein [Fimbriimonadales bacterium]|nr:DUF1800 domain-containing protein [Fimbriimonadales bacterium]